MQKRIWNLCCERVSAFAKAAAVAALAMTSGLAFAAPPAPLPFGIEPPAYRGMISTNRRDPNVHFTVILNPPAGNAQGTKIQVAVADVGGKILAKQEVVAPGAGRIPASLPLAADAPAGEYTLTANANGQSAAAKFKIVPVRPGQMFVDQDGVLLDEGKPFFPIGLYHAHSWQIDEWAPLGVNLVQMWDWDWADPSHAASLDKFKAAHVRVIYEGPFWGQIIGNMGKPDLKQYPFETDAKLRSALEQARDDSRHLLAMWYLADEASGKGVVPHINRARDFLHALDEDHPTYNLSNGDPDVAESGDIFAIDCYPRYVANQPAPLTRVSETVDRVRKVVGDSKPIIVVPQAFGENNDHKEKPAEVRCMSYLALTHGIQGILWYCWKQTGDWNGAQKQGAGWNPPTAEMLKKVIAEIKVFAPALMEPGRRMLRSDDGSIHAILCGNEKTGRFLVYVNGEEKPVDSALQVPELANATLEPLFGGPSASVSGGKLQLKLPSMATGAFRVKAN